MAWQVNGTPDTLSSSGDTVEITDLSGLTFNVFLQSRIATGGAEATKYQYNLDTGSNYSNRQNADGGTDSTQTNEDSCRTGSVDTVNGFIFGYC